MTIDTVAEWTAVVAAHEAAQAALQAYEADPANENDTEGGADLSDAEAMTWTAMIHTPAPDAAAMVLKLRALFDAHAKYTGDDVDNLAFLTRLLDDNDWAGGFPLVRLLQDALRLAGIDSPVLTVRPWREMDWPDLVAAYRASHAFINRPGSANVTEEEEANHEPIRRAVFGYPVTTLAQLQEKVDLIRRDEGVEEGGYKDVANDIRRLAGKAQ